VLRFGSNFYSGFVTPFVGDPKSSKYHLSLQKFRKNQEDN
jgi:hypothetical protein